jgi:hypothetical protein
MIAIRPTMSTPPDETSPSESAYHAPAPLSEPPTPMWLTAVGGALFLIAGMWWAVTPSAKSPSEEAGNSASANAADAGVAQIKHP